MADRREQILARLEVVLTGLPGVAAAYRNNLDIPDTSRPAIAILDGDEDTDDNDVGEMVRRIVARPEVYILVSGTGAAIDTTIGSIRDDIIDAVLADPTLKTYTLNQSSVAFQGSATGLMKGRKIEGEANVAFAFRYILDVNSL